MRIKIFFIFLLISHITMGQDKISICYDSLSAICYKKELKKFPKSLDVRDSLDINKKKKMLLLNLWGIGFIQADIESRLMQNGDCLHINTGPKYTWKQLKYRGDEEMAISILKENEYVKWEALKSKIDKQLSFYENHGYPFANCYLDSLIIKEDFLSGILVLNKGRLVKIDSLNIKTEGKLDVRLIKRITGIKKGSLYSESEIKNCKNRISETSYLQLINDPELTFTDSYTKLTLIVKAKKANQFDGIIGFLPDNETGKIQFTGQVRLKLLNSLKKGEQLDAEWRKLPSGSRDIKFKGAYPYILGSPLGVDGNFKLFQRDTLFNDISGGIGIQFSQINRLTLRVFNEFRELNVFNNENDSAQSQLNGSQIKDAKYRQYGFSLKLDKTDFSLNPTSGYKIFLKSAVGNRLLNSAQASDEVNSKGIVYSFESGIEFFKKVTKNLVLAPLLKSAGMLNQKFYINEAYRIGGFQSIRGFDEESVFATNYVYFNTEMRYLIGNLSYIYVFGSTCWLERNFYDSYSNDWPVSTGAGIVFETKAGLINLTYALGKQLDNPWLLRSAKIHFGIISVF